MDHEKHTGVACSRKNTVVVAWNDMVGIIIAVDLEPGKQQFIYIFSILSNKIFWIRRILKYNYHQLTVMENFLSYSFRIFLFLFLFLSGCKQRQDVNNPENKGNDTRVETKQPVLSESKNPSIVKLIREKKLAADHFDKDNSIAGKENEEDEKSEMRERENEERENGENEENDEYDGPQFAAKMDFDRTKDPATGKVPREKYLEAQQRTIESKNES